MTALPDFAPGTALTTTDFLAYGPTETVIPASGTSVLGSWPITSPAYLVSLDSSIGAGALLNMHGYFMQWLDPNTGELLDAETWYSAASSNAIGTTSALIGGRGPAKSGQLQLTVANYDSGQALTVNAAVYQSTRVVSRDDWRHLGLTAVPNFTVPFLDPTNGVLGFVPSRALGAGATISRLCTMFAGQAQLIIGNSAGSSLAVQVNSLNPPIGAADLVLLYSTSVTANQTIINLTLPRAPVQVSITNNGAATNVEMSMIQQEFSS